MVYAQTLKTWQFKIIVGVDGQCSSWPLLYTIIVCHVLSHSPSSICTHTFKSNPSSDYRKKEGLLPEFNWLVVKKVNGCRVSRTHLQACPIYFQFSQRVQKGLRLIKYIGYYDDKIMDELVIWKRFVTMRGWCYKGTCQISLYNTAKVVSLCYNKQAWSGQWRRTCLISLSWTRSMLRLLPITDIKKWERNGCWKKLPVPLLAVKILLLFWLNFLDSKHKSVRVLKERIRTQYWLEYGDNNHDQEFHWCIRSLNMIKNVSLAIVINNQRHMFSFTIYW